MKTPTRKEAAALTRSDAIASAEQTRWSLWEAVSVIDRVRAMGVAGIDKGRAVEPIASFSDDERVRIAFALQVHISRMELLAKLMTPVKTNLSGYLH